MNPRSNDGSNLHYMWGGFCLSAAWAFAKLGNRCVSPVWVVCRNKLGMMVAVASGSSSPTANRPTLSAGIVSSCSPLFLRLLLCVPSVEGNGYMRYLVLWMPRPSKLTGHEIIISRVIGGVKPPLHSCAERHSRRWHLLPGETWFPLSGSLDDDSALLPRAGSSALHHRQLAECREVGLGNMRCSGPANGGRAGGFVGREQAWRGHVFSSTSMN